MNPSRSGSGGGAGGNSHVNKNDLHNIPLAHLPLRPSSLKVLQQAGFVTSREVVQAKQGNSNGLATLAAELSMTVAQAASIYREVVETSSLCKDDENKDHNRPTQQHQLQQQQHSNHQYHHNKRPLVKLSSSSSSSSGACSASTSALSLLQQNHGGGGGMTGNAATAICNTSVEAIVTFCRPVDQLLGGGIALQELTEISGKPGTGKTQFGMQLAVDARLPLSVGGVAGECIYLDSEGSFSPERCYTLARALVHHVQAGQKKRQQQAKSSTGLATPVISMPPWFTPESILQGIHVFRVHDVAAQTAALMGAIPQLLQERQAAGSPVRLIVIDSIAFHYRAAADTSTALSNSGGADFMDRTRQLTRVASHLAELAMTFKVAVVTLNQMTTKVVAAASGGARSSNPTTAMDRHEVVPALGEAWAHAVTSRLLLVNHDEAFGQAADDSYGGGAGGLNNKKVLRRSCHLIKSPRLAPGRAFFQVCESGIRGLEFENRRHDNEQKNARSDPSNNQQYASKRHRA